MNESNSLMNELRAEGSSNQTIHIWENTYPHWESKRIKTLGANYKVSNYQKLRHRCIELRNIWRRPQ